jgi:homoserine kinase
VTAPRPLAVFSVPASTSNLGAGFDCLGLALALHLTVEVTTVVDDGRGNLQCTFTDGPPPGDNLIAHGFEAVCRRTGRRDLPSASVVVSCEIPPASGLGSSAAALVAGGRIAAFLLGDVTDQDILEVATAIEGHPDNVGAALYGGLVAGLVHDAGGVSAVALPWPADLRVVVATPALPLATRTARGVLPTHVSRADAVFNLQRSAVLLAAIVSGRHDAIRAALDDRLHQPHRLALVPGLEEALGLQADGLLGVFLSGAGPSIAAFTTGHVQPTMHAFERLYARLGLEARVRALDVHQPERAVPAPSIS